MTDTPATPDGPDPAPDSGPTPGDWTGDGFPDPADEAPLLRETGNSPTAADGDQSGVPEEPDSLPPPDGE